MPMSNYLHFYRIERYREGDKKGKELKVWTGEDYDREDKSS